MSDPIDAIEELLRQRGWSRRYLYPALGSSGKASEIMNRVRPLSLPMIRCLVINYGMDAATMIKWYPTTNGGASNTSPPFRAGLFPRDRP